MNLDSLCLTHPWVITEFEKHSNLVVPDCLWRHKVPSDVEEILVLFADNESQSDVSFGDVVTREPMLRLISQVFPRAAITVILKPYHHSLSFLPIHKNVIYKKCCGNSHFRNKRFTRKTHRDIVSIKDFSGKKWDIVIDSTSRDGYTLVKDILQNIGRRRIGCFIPANIISSVWFANSANNHHRCNSRMSLPLKSHELFILRLAFGIPSIISHYNQSLVPQCSMYGELVKRKDSAIQPLSCFLVDKSPCSYKMWMTNDKNPLDEVVEELQKTGFDVFLHRFFAPEETPGNVPRYIRARPSLITCPLDELARFYLNTRPKLVLGIDTGIMHFLKSITFDGKAKFLSIFTDGSQDPIVWSPPGSIVFSSLRGTDGPGLFFGLTPFKLIEYISQVDWINE